MRTGPRMLLALAVPLVFLLGANVASATPISINIGTLSIEAGVGTSNQAFFAITNYTGSNALPDDFPIIDDTTLLDWTLTLTGPSDTRTISRATLGAIGPGAFLDSAGVPFTELLFEADLFTSASFIATLDRDQLSTSAAAFLLDSSSFTAELIAPAGLFLQVGDTVLLSVIGDEAVAAVPEPGTVALVAAGIGMMVRRHRRRRLG